MAIVNAASNLNAEANVFSPIPSMSNLKMDFVSIAKGARELDGEDYEERILIKKIQRTVMGSAERRRSHQFIEYCRFCKNNGEKEEMYLSHVTKDSEGNAACPVLRNYVCPKCGETGDKAHTVSYCPKRLRRRSNSQEPGRRLSVGSTKEEESDDPRIPTPMVGHIINRMMLEREE